MRKVEMTPHELMAMEPVVVVKGIDAFKMIKGEIHDHLPEVYPNTFYTDDDWWLLAEHDNRIMIKVYSKGTKTVGVLYYAHLAVMVFEHDVFMGEDRYVLDAKYFEMLVTYIKELGARLIPEPSPEIYGMDDDLYIEL